MMRHNALATEARDRYRKLPYYGGWEPGRMLGGFGQHRDSDPLEESNFAAALRTYQEAGVEFRVDSFSHWAVGWVEEITLPITPQAIETLDALRERIENYPVLDDEDYSEREWESDHPGETECYSEDSDCPCGRGQ